MTYHILLHVPDATDFCSLAESVEILHGQVNNIQKQL